VKIHLPTYPQGVHKITETLDARDLKLDPEVFFAPLQATLKLDRHDPYLQFEFNLDTETRQECDRCLAIFEQPLQVTAPMMYILGKDPAEGAADDDPGLSYIPTTTTDLDVSNDLRDFVILAMPNRNLCSEDCKGLCSVCGADLNVQDCPHVPLSSESN
jgi:uncharacterized protein